MGQPLRILVVDDSVDDALLLMHALREDDANLVYRRVETAEEMRAALSEPWDAILADYTLPRFSGLDALRLMQELGIDLPFIMVSGKEGEETAVEVMRAGAHDYILKSNLARLAPAIEREMREAALRGERGHTLDTLERERAFLTSAIELLPFPIIFNDLDGRVLRANRASYAFFADLDSAHWWESTLLTADKHTVVPREAWPMMRSARGEVVSAVEGIIVLPDDREVPVLAYSAPVYLGTHIVASVVAFQDITSLKEMDRAKDRFLAVLSHELRTPLSNMLGWVKEARESPDILPQALEIIQRNAENQQRMLENLLEVSRMLHGKLQLLQSRTDLWALAMQATESMRSLADTRHVTLVLEPPPVALPVRADTRRMLEIFVNILDNALKYTGPGGSVTLCGAREDARAVITIQDTGRGMSPAELENVFKIFFQPDIAEAAEGLRLSMGLAQFIMELHGGRITAASDGMKQGTTIRVELPLVDELPAPA
jgi:signal transduction histidine kinase